MSDMIERAALAFIEAIKGSPSHVDVSEGLDCVTLDGIFDVREGMRAAIEAMRGDVVPVFEDISNMDREWKQSRLTADMLNAGECAAWCNGGRPFGYNGVLNIWRAMIDAALNPPSESK